MVNLPVSTVHRMLVRHGLNRLDHLDRVARGKLYLKAEGPTSRGRTDASVVGPK